MSLLKYFAPPEWDADVPDENNFSNLTKKSKLKKGKLKKDDRAPSEENSRETLSKKRKHSESEKNPDDVPKKKKKKSKKGCKEMENRVVADPVPQSMAQTKKNVDRKTSSDNIKGVSVKKLKEKNQNGGNKNARKKKLKELKLQPNPINVNPQKVQETRNEMEETKMNLENGGGKNKKKRKRNKNKKVQENSEEPQKMEETTINTENSVGKNKKKRNRNKNKKVQENGDEPQKMEETIIITENSVSKNKKKRKRNKNKKVQENGDEPQKMEETITNTENSIGENKKKRKRNKNKISEGEPVKSNTENVISFKNKSIEKGSIKFKQLKTQGNKKDALLKSAFKLLLSKVPASVLDEDHQNTSIDEHSNTVDEIIKEDQKQQQKSTKKPTTLRERMLERLKGARFRYLNEQMYVKESNDALKIFKEDPSAFQAYHEGYRQQVKKWPLNPLDTIIKDVKKMPKEYIVADLGCGDGRLAQSVPQKVYSFDLVALNPSVTACDMTHTPLLTSQVNVVVFCLSLMGTNLKEYIIEANRILKIGGIVKVAEVESRFENVEDFTKDFQKYGFSLTKSDLNHNLFYFIDFKKESDIKKRNKLPTLTLKPCFYKKR